MGVLEGDTLEFGDPFLFNIFEEVVPERDEGYFLVVQFYLLSILSVDHESFDLVVVVLTDDLPALFTQKFIVPMLD